MPVYAASTLKQQVRRGTARPAESAIKLSVFTQLLGLFAVRATVVPAVEERPKGKDAFEAIRHGCAVTSPNLRVASPEDAFVPLRHVAVRGESYRGKHGKLTVIRKPR